MSPVAVELLAAVREAVGTLRTHIANDDPKVSLKAVAELSKLVGVCAKLGLEVAEPEAVLPPPPAPKPQPIPRAERQEPFSREPRTLIGEGVVAEILQSTPPPRSAPTRAGPIRSPHPAAVW